MRRIRLKIKTMRKRKKVAGKNIIKENLRKDGACREKEKITRKKQ
jgi:hypothetical protein